MNRQRAAATLPMSRYRSVSQRLAWNHEKISQTWPLLLPLLVQLFLAL